MWVGGGAEVPPALVNVTCGAQGVGGGVGVGGASVGAGGVVRAGVLVLLALCTLLANTLLILVLNWRRYLKYIDNQPRYLLTSLALNDLMSGGLLAPVALLPALYRCWPYSQTFCQIQAVLRGALSQQSAVILVCMAVDRYLYLLHPKIYHRHASKKGCVVMLSVTWVASVCACAAVVLAPVPRPSLPAGADASSAAAAAAAGATGAPHPPGYFFDSTGLLACDLYHARLANRILACCAYYFPTTMVLMYCYGSGFHAAKHKGAATEEVVAAGAGAGLSTSRTMAAMSLGFIVVVTPQSIEQVVAACTGCRPPPALHFALTYLALSPCALNPAIYWLLNSHFRRLSALLAKRLLRVCCCRRRPRMRYRTPSYPSKLPVCCESPPPPPQPLCLDAPVLLKDEPCWGGAAAGERYWGEILERTVSSSSLQRAAWGCACPAPAAPYPTPYFTSYRARPPSDLCLYRPTEELERGRSRSNLSLDEAYRYSGRPPDL